MVFRSLVKNALLTLSFLLLTVFSVQAFSDNPAYPNVRFAVISDLHTYDPALGINGAAFHEYLINDRKLIAQSSEILDTAVQTILKEKPQFVLIPGDMTKDGEEHDHLYVAQKLSKITHAGIPVFIINGNHDINNGWSYSFNEKGRTQIPNVDDKEFKQIWTNFGFSKAFDYDTDSESYAAVLAPGLWLVAVDSCRWKENKPGVEHIVSGRLTEKTQAWLSNILVQAGSKGAAVIGMMHHGVLEHYKNNKKFYPEYVVKDNDKIADLFAAFGVRMVLTGHYHAQDVTSSFRKDGWLYDIETGSLVTYPCPYRIIQITNNTAVIKSGRIESIKSYPVDFQNFAREYLFEGTVGMAAAALKKYGLSGKDFSILGPQIADAYMMHLSGDENPPAQVVNTKGISILAALVIWNRRGLLYGWQHDLSPADNDLKINLSTGKAD